jgi:hypothetical protein
MKPERSGSARRLACLTALGCLLGAATVAGMTFVSAAAPASADTCSAAYANVEGGRLSQHYGNRGHIYVNTNSTVNAYNYGFIRSLGVISDNNNYVEIGWSAHISGTTSPQVFAEWNDRGTPNGYNYKLVPYDTDQWFKVVNPPGGNPIFQYWFGDDSSPFKYSPTMNFGTGQVLGNSERRNWCQSLFTHMYDLNDYTSSGWETWDGWAGCTNTTSRNPFYMHKDSDTELHVTSSSSGALC